MYKKCRIEKKKYEIVQTNVLNGKITKKFKFQYLFWDIIHYVIRTYIILVQYVWEIDSGGFRGCAQGHMPSCDEFV